MTSNKKGSPGWAVYKNKRRLARKGIKYLPAIGTIGNKKVLRAPKLFSVMSNRDASVIYFNSVLDSVNSGTFSVMDMSSIEKTDLPTVSLIISMMMDPRSKANSIRQYLQVRTPGDLLPSSEIFKKVNFKQTVTSGHADGNYFMSRLSSVINEHYTQATIDYANNFFQNETSSSMLSGILVEMFSNTNNHATPKDDDEYKIPWFLSVLENDGKLCFCVTDLGVGIFESLKLGDVLDEKLIKSSIDTILDMYDNSQSKYLSLAIPDGIHSSTGKSYRGKGIKTIFEKASSSSNISKFVIISNKATVDLKNITKIEHDSSDSLNGTILYWEMVK